MRFFQVPQFYRYWLLSKLSDKSVVSLIRNSYVNRYGNCVYSIAEINDSLTDSKTNIYLQEQKSHRRFRSIRKT